MNDGKSHLAELNLNSELRNAIKESKLIAQNKPTYADVFLITVPTPFKVNSSKIPLPEINYVYSAIESCIPFLKQGNIIIIESTCPVGTTEKINNFLLEKNVDMEEIYLAYCPERVLPGNILYELVNNDRVIGGINEKSSKFAYDFYKTFCRGNLKISNARTAEMVKLSENAFRDVNLAFANEISMICDKNKIDPNELINIANSHPRVNILKPGCGVGGHCIAVDPWFIVYENENESQLIHTSRKVNNRKTEWVIEKIIDEVNNIKIESNNLPKLCCLGLTFKANVDDCRQSPALKIAQKLLSKNLDVTCCDPNLKEIDSIVLSSLQNCLKKCDFFICLVEHDEFKKINFGNKKVIDFCGLI